MSKKVFSKRHSFDARCLKAYDAACSDFISRMKSLKAKPVFYSGRMHDGAVRIEYWVETGRELKVDGVYRVTGDISVVASCYSDDRRLDFLVTSRQDEKGVELVLSILEAYFSRD